MQSAVWKIPAIITYPRHTTLMAMKMTCARSCGEARLPNVIRKHQMSITAPAAIQRIRFVDA